MREQLILAGVKNLQTFGYKNVSAENILTDLIYKEFFSRILVETRDAVDSKKVKQVCDELLAEIEK